jgi:hypothetical protein
MNKDFIILLSFFFIITIVPTISLSKSFSQSYIKIDGSVVPLLIPPYKTIKGIINDTITTQINNVTFYPYSH